MGYALGLLAFSDPIPLPFRIVFGLMAMLGIYGGIRHILFLFKRRSALSGGRERKGTVKLRGPLDDDATSALLSLKTAYGEWLLSVEPDDVMAHATALQEGMPARATVGEDEKPYSFEIAGKTIPLLSDAIVFKGMILKNVERFEGGLAERKAKQTGLKQQS